MELEYEPHHDREFIWKGMMNYRCLDVRQREKVIDAVIKYLRTPVPDNITEEWLENISIYRRFLQRVENREYETCARLRNKARRIIRPHNLYIVKV